MSIEQQEIKQQDPLVCLADGNGDAKKAAYAYYLERRRKYPLRRDLEVIEAW